MSVHRTRSLPAASARGRLVVGTDVVAATVAALRRSGGDDGRHEALLFWAGRRVGHDSYVLTAVAPRIDHGRSHVVASERAVGAAARAARRVRLTIVAQVHSHPGTDTRHSDGDDELVLMPFPGMFSLVVASYGEGGIGPGSGAGVHQHQDGQWVAVTHPDNAVVIVPPLLEVA